MMANRRKYIDFIEPDNWGEEINIDDLINQLNKAKNEGATHIELQGDEFFKQIACFKWDDTTS